MAFACASDTVEIRGELGRPIALASGDTSPLPRLLVGRGACPGEAGACSSVCVGPPAECPPDACLPVVVDSLAPVTAVATTQDTVTAERGCIELRAAAGALADPVDAADLAATVARFRFGDLPMARVPIGGEIWDWQIGDEGDSTHVGAVLGGNLLRHLAVRFIARRGEAPTISFYREFPGSEAALADQGRAFIPIQFPGQLLGKEITDECVAGEDDCDFIGFHLDDDRVRSAIQPSQIVLDACLVPPPGAVYFTDARRCSVAPGPGVSAADYISPTGRIASRSTPSCNSSVALTADDRPDLAGRAATLVVATGIPDLVLFADSTARLFGDLAALPECSSGGVIGSDALDSPACRESEGGALHPSGFPAAGVDTPLPKIRVSSLALLPGLTTTTGPSPCARLEARMAGLAAQCAGVLRERAPYPAEESACTAAADEHAIILGEFERRRGTLGPDPALWIPARIVPETHPLAIAVRRNVVPEALQPDGLLGTALLQNTDVILDYTDENPGVRVACSDPGAAGCFALPACTRSSGAVRPSCCFGLPQNLLVEMISDFGLYGCCPALSEGARRELNCKALAEGRDPLCPEVACDE